MEDYKVNPEQCQLVCLKISISKRWKFIFYVLLWADGPLSTILLIISARIGNIFQSTRAPNNEVAAKYDYIISVNAYTRIKCSFAFHALWRNKINFILNWCWMCIVTRANICVSAKPMLKMHLLMAFDLANKFVHGMRFNTRFNKIQNSNKNIFSGTQHSLLFRCYIYESL